MKQTMTRIMSMALAIVMVLAITPALSLATDSGTLTVEVATVKSSAGESVDVTIDLKNNPGISSAKFKVSFDDSVLTLNSVTYNTSMGGNVVPPQKLTSPVTLTWVNAFGEYSADAAFATLNFTVSESAEPGVTTGIELTYDPNDIYNLAEDNVDTIVVNGGVTILACIPGDINGDESVNNKDASRLLQYLADWDVVVNTPTLDVNGDESVNNKDATRLLQYLAGYDVEIFCACGMTTDPTCEHSMTATEAKVASCTEDGNVAYWSCSVCNKVYLDANGSSEIALDKTVIAATGHAFVVIPAVEPTTTTYGSTEGLQCSVCGYYKIKPEPIEPIEPDIYTITYNVTNGDTYLASYLSDKGIVNSNPASYVEEDDIITLSYYTNIPGYTFEGWYDGTGEDAVIVKEIDPSQKKNITLYAKWTKNAHKVTLDNKLDAYRNGTEFTTEFISRTVDETTILPQNLTREHYIFMGWSDASGKIVETVEPGVTDVTVYANWTSQRNQTKANDYLTDGPIIKEDVDGKKYYFTYYLGQMINVPLYVAHDLGYVDGNIAVEESIESTKSTEKQEAESFNSTLSNATTKSSSWTLSNDWNELITEVEGKETSVSDEQTVAVSSGTSTAYSSSGSTYVGNSFHTSNDNLTTSKTVTDDSYKLGVEASVGASYGPVKAEVKASAETAHSDHQEDYSENKTSMSLDSEWNSSNSYSRSGSSSRNESVTNSILNEASEKWELEISKSIGGSDSSTTSDIVTLDETNGYSSSLSYNVTEKTVTVQKISTADATPGYYRYVCVGDFHVFAIVTYDIETGTYSVHNQSVMDDSTRVYLDYSAVDPHYGDYNNGVLPFEVPIDVYNYVFDSLCLTDGIIIDDETGIVTDYEGDATQVYIPDYVSYYNEIDGTYSSVKVTGINADVFAGKDFIKTVKLSKFITEIHDGAFAGCTALEGVKYDTLTYIGEDAFNDCTSLGKFTVADTVETLGADAFCGVAEIEVNAKNAAVVEAAVDSGAKSLTLNLLCLEDTLADKALVVDATDRFTLNGNGVTYSNVSLEVNAATTVLNRITFADNKAIPLNITSANLTLSQVDIIDAPGFALVLGADSTNVSLVSKNNISAVGDYAILTKGIALKRAEGVTSTTNLTVSGGDIYLCGTEDDATALKASKFLSRTASEVVVITAKEYGDLLSARTVIFDANGGEVSENERTVVYGQAIGELPVPTLDYYTFNGWYTEIEGGEQVTAETTVVADTTLYAQWTINDVSEWVLASELPEDSEVVGEKWSYTLREYAESPESSYSDWTKYDTQRTSWGTTTGPVYSDPSNGSRNVWSEQYVSSTTNHYKYYHRYGWGTNVSTGVSGYVWGSDSQLPNGTRHAIDLTYSLTKGTTFAGNDRWKGYTCPHCGEANIWLYDGVYTTNNYSTRWYYQEPVYFYYYYRDVELEAASDPTGESNVSNVVKWVQYRAK